jgi:flagellar hook-length control protein FliK
VSAVRATPFLADAGATPASRPQSTGPTDGSFAVQLLGVTAGAAKTAAQKLGTATTATATPPAATPVAAPNAASDDGSTVDALPVKFADVPVLPTIDARGHAGKATAEGGADKSHASKPAPDGSDTPGLLAMVALAMPVPMTSVAPAVPVAAGATDETAVNGSSVPVSLVSAAAANAADPLASVATPAPASAAVAVPPGGAVVGAPVSAASTSSATDPAPTSSATGPASASPATDPAPTSSATASVDTPPARVKARTTAPDAAASTGSATGNASTAAATGVPSPIAPVQQGDVRTKDQSANEPSLAAVASAASVPAAPVAPPAAAAAPTPVAPAVPTQAFTDQIARPILTLREADAGTHVLTIRVAPDSLGPVTVRAHLGADGIRIELLAPTDQGRNALNAILPDLKRDLAQGGMNSTVNVSSQPDTNAQQGASGQFGARADAGAAGSGGQSARQDAWSSRTGSQPTQPQTPLRPAIVGGTSLLDVYA